MESAGNPLSGADWSLLEPLLLEPKIRPARRALGLLFSQPEMPFSNVCASSLLLSCRSRLKVTFLREGECQIRLMCKRARSLPLSPLPALHFFTFLEIRMNRTQAEHLQAHMEGSRAPASATKPRQPKHQQLPGPEIASVGRACRLARHPGLGERRHPWSPWAE